MDTELKAKNFYRPLTDSQTCKASETVGSVLDRIDTVHGALIACNDDGDFVGVLSSYKTLYKNHTPPGKKVEHAVIQPMLITKETPLSEIAKFMASEKVYLLPVFENSEVIGTISAVDVVKRMFHDQNLLMATSEELRSDHPMLLDTNAKVKEAYSLLRANGVSEVIVTDKQGKIAGVVTRSDIKHAFIHPTDKQRFHHDNYRPDDLSFDEEKKKRDDESIRGYMSAFICSVDEDASNTEKILAVLESDQQHVIVTNKAEVPVGIISYRNLLESIARITPEDEVNIIFEKPGPEVYPLEFNQAVHDLSGFIQKLNKRLPIERVEVRVQQPKFAAGKTAEYDITLQIDPFTGSQYVVHGKGVSYKLSLRNAMQLMLKQLEKSALRFKKHRKKSLAQASTEPLKQMFH